MFPVRTVSVLTGDAFYAGAQSFVVAKIEASESARPVAVGYYSPSGRMSRISVRRLQDEYMRLGTKATRAATKKIWGRVELEALRAVRGLIKAHKKAKAGAR